MPDACFGQTTNLTDRRTWWFRWLAAAIICGSLIGTYQLGIDRGLRDRVGPGAWGRVLFGVGTAITMMDHGGYGYAFSNIVEAALSRGGLTDDAGTLAALGSKFPDNLSDPTLLNSAFQKAAEVKTGDNPNEVFRGSSGDDLGFVDYVRLSFFLFGHTIQSLYYSYFFLFALSAVAFVAAYRRYPVALVLLAVTSLAQLAAFSSVLFAPRFLGSVGDPRALSALGIVPTLHLALLMLWRVRPAPRHVVLAVLQATVLVFAVWIRASAGWALVGLVTFGILVAITEFWKRRFQLRCLWSVAVLLAVLAVHTVWVTISLHPIYKNSGAVSHHMFWHSVFYGLQFHPQWEAKYAASYDFQSGDALPMFAVRQYLARHPSENTDDLYVTPLRQNLKFSVADSYIRKIYFEFFANDPRFALEVLLIFNPRGALTVIGDCFASLAQTGLAIKLWIAICLIVLAGALSFDGNLIRSLGGCSIVMTVAFPVSLLPNVIAVWNIPTMLDQFFIFLILLGGWVVYAMSVGIRMVGRAISAGSG